MPPVASQSSAPQVRFRSIGGCGNASRGRRRLFWFLARMAAAGLHRCRPGAGCAGHALGRSIGCVRRRSVSLVGSMVLGFQGLRADVGGSPAPWDDYWYSAVCAPSVAGMRITPDTVKRLSTVIAAVSAKGARAGRQPMPDLRRPSWRRQDSPTSASEFPLTAFDRPNEPADRFRVLSDAAGAHRAAGQWLRGDHDQQPRTNRRADPDASRQRARRAAF